MSTPSKTTSTQSPTPVKPAPPSTEGQANGTPNGTPSTSSTTFNKTRHIDRLDAHALTLSPTHYITKTLTTNTLAESLFSGSHPTFASACAAHAPTLSLDVIATSLAVQLVFATQLLETRRVNKGTALRAIANRMDGFAERRMQEVWDEAWEEVKAEEEERRKQREEVRAGKGQGGLKEGEKEGEKGEKRNSGKGGSKKGSQKRKEKMARGEAAAEKGKEKVDGGKGKVGGGSGAGIDKKSGFMNGGVNRGEKFRMDGKEKVTAE